MIPQRLALQSANLCGGYEGWRKVSEGHDPSLHSQTTFTAKALVNPPFALADNFYNESTFVETKPVGENDWEPAWT